MMIKNKVDTNCWNILIVDDKKDLHTITINAFFDEEINNKEINFFSAFNEKEAIDLLREIHYDISVIILDMVMENKGDEGINVLKFLKEKLMNRSTQVILRTAYSGKSEVKEIIRSFPEVRILKKGETSVEELIELVRSAIEKYNEVVKS